MRVKKYYFLLIAIHFLLSAIYFPHSIKHSDSLIRQSMIEGFLKHGDFRLMERGLRYTQPTIFTITPDNTLYPPYPPFPSLLAIPFYLFFKYVLHVDTFYALTFLNHLIVLMCILVFFTISSLFFSSDAAFKLSLMALTTPFLLYYQRTFFMETLFALCNLLLLYFYLKKDWNKKDIILSAGVIIAGLTTKYVFALSVFLWFLFNWFTFPHKRKKLFILVIVFLLTLAGDAYYKSWRYPPNTTFPTTYKISFYLQSLPHSILDGMAGLLLSSGRGLFILNPLTFLGFISLFIWKEKKFLYPLTVFLGYYLFYSGWFMWNGGICFGTRYLVSTYLFLLLPVGFILENYKKWKTQKIIAVIIFVFYLLGVYVNIQSLRIDDLHFFKVFTIFLTKQSGLKIEEVFSDFRKKTMINTEFYTLTDWNWNFSPYAYFRFPASAIPKLYKMTGITKKLFLVTILISSLGIIYISFYLLKIWKGVKN